jgi:hypothetical protein
MDEVILEEWAYVQESVKAASSQKVQLPGVNVQDELRQPVGFRNATSNDHDFQMLVNMRQKHQTKQAAVGVRTRNITSIADKTAEIHCSLICQFHAALKEGQDSLEAGTAGLECQRRWNCLPSGNAANTTVVAANTSKQVCCTVQLLSLCLLISIVRRQHAGNKFSQRHNFLILWSLLMLG